MADPTSVDHFSRSGESVLTMRLLAETQTLTRAERKVIRQIEKVQAILVKLGERKAELLRELGGS